MPLFGPLSTTRYVVNGVSFDTIRVPPGRFVDGEGEAKRELLISRPFELMVTPVTQALWRAVTGLNPSHFEGEDLPVEEASWYDARWFIEELSRQGLPGFRLPTEAEWAWSARCGVPAQWSGADRPASVAATRPYSTTSTHPVASLAPPASGAFDFSGNVWEWVDDRWSDIPAGGVDVSSLASGSSRVIRGGGWGRDPRYARVVRRNYNAPGDRSSSLGVRLIRTVH